jgi:hypothetical protein
MASSQSWYQSQTWTLDDEGNKTEGAGGGGGGAVEQKADKILKCYKYAQESLQQAREDSEKAMRYVNNDSWAKTDMDTAKKHSKPVLKYNILMPILSALQGNEQLNKKRAAFKPNGVKSVNVSDIVQGRWNMINDEESVEEKLQLAFLDALILKLGGWVQRSFEMDADGYLEFKYDVLNPMRVFADPETKTSDYMLDHCRWIVKEGWETLDVLQDKYEIPYSELKKSEEKYGWWNMLSEYFKRFRDSNYTQGSSESYDKENDRYKILEMQERVSRKMVRFFDGEQYFSMPVEEYRTIKKDNPNIQFVTDYEMDKIMVTTMIPYFKNLIVMEKEIGTPVARFDVFPIFSYSLGTQITEATSLIDLLLDVQDDVNKGKSQLRDYVTKILSGGIFIDKREKDTIKRLREQGNQPNQIYELNNPALPPQQMPPAQIPPDIFNNTENSIMYADRVSMVNQAMRGNVEQSGESGVLFKQKVERAAAAVNPYFKNLQNLRKAIAQDFIDNFGYVYAEEDRVMKFKNPDNHFIETIINLRVAGQVINDVSNPSLFVEMEEGTDNITQKEDNFEKMLALINIISQINPQFVDIRTLISNAPVTGVDKMLSYIDQMIEAQSQASQEEAQMEKTKATLENQKIERGMINDEEKLRIEAAKATNQKAEA